MCSKYGKFFLVEQPLNIDLFIFVTTIAMYCHRCTFFGMLMADIAKAISRNFRMSSGFSQKHV